VRVVVTKSATVTGWRAARPRPDPVMGPVDEQLAPTSRAISAKAAVRNLARIALAPATISFRLVLAGQTGYLVEVDPVLSRVTP